MALQSREEFLAFLKLIREEFDDLSRPINVLDIGFYYGAVAVGIIRAILSSGHRCKVATIDIEDHWRRNPEALGITKDLEAEMGENFKVITGRSQDVAVQEQVKEFFGENHPIDLLFIDGDHSERGVIQDYLAYVDRVGPGWGMICFHDIYMDSVAKAWEQIRDRGGWATLELCQKKGFYGIGIIWRGVLALPLPDPSDMTYNG